MIVSKQFTAVCRGCKKQIELREYKGLEGGLYGCHHCPELSELFCKRPRIRKTFEQLKEVA